MHLGKARTSSNRSGPRRFLSATTSQCYRLWRIAPFEFASVTSATLKNYDEKRGGFALFGSQEILPSINSSLAISWSRQFEPPDHFVQLDPIGAEKFLHRINFASGRDVLGVRRMNCVRVGGLPYRSSFPTNRLSLEIHRALHGRFADETIFFSSYNLTPQPYLTAGVPPKLSVPIPGPSGRNLLPTQIHCGSWRQLG